MLTAILLFPLHLKLLFSSSSGANSLFGRVLHLAGGPHTLPYFSLRLSLNNAQDTSKLTSHPGDFKLLLPFLTLATVVTFDPHAIPRIKYINHFVFRTFKASDCQTGCE